MAKTGKKGALRKFKTVNEECQVAAHKGILDALLSAKASAMVAGLHLWNWLPCVSPSAGSCLIGPADNAKSPQGKAADATVRSYYSRTGISARSGRLKSDDPT